MASDLPISTPADKPARRMVRAELLGKHSHATKCGFVCVWVRCGKYLARGRLDGRQFGETLGNNEEAAEGRLHGLIAEFNSGAYVRPSDANRRPLRRAVDPRLSFRQVCDDFLADKRRLRGQTTTRTYSSRLAHAIAFAEMSDNQRRWPFARDIDRDFALALRSFLFQRQTTRNGRPGAKPKPMSPRQVVNVLETVRSVLAWAARPDIGRLPAGFINPMTTEIVGQVPTKDPLRLVKFTQDQLVSLIGAMDRWQLCHLGLLCVLAPRPDDFVGLLVEDVDFRSRCLEIGTRLGGNDFGKTRQSFRIPFPREAEPLLVALVGGRVAGPLFRSRAEFIHAKRSAPASPEELTTGYDQFLARLSPDAVQTEQDRKAAFRRFMVKLGGASTDRLADEFDDLVLALDRRRPGTLYDLKHATSQLMKDSGMPHLDLQYLTCHSSGDILNEYTRIDLEKSMAKYLAAIPSLLSALATRVAELGMRGYSNDEKLSQLPIAWRDDEV